MKARWPTRPSHSHLQPLPQDLAELEAAVGQQLLPLEQLGGPARALRAFRRLLFLEGPELEGSPLLKELPRPEVRDECDHSWCLQVSH